ncbi:uncharacterized protein BJ171DRAFT_511045 [Polychytrium aggregatum]|uniref:uncharacterized protein n=1 Tax=Polychytrium aggregatum TaxID=110093 RepID=UPI0022FEF280|nr:uncharacterized protein BJ171DRAFT_511045 [Polychytrium aggregatum]KAI9203175.1 hypothetical protein BJ171DRAFT_511045 [Polychytrium aggregatum]
MPRLHAVVASPEAAAPSQPAMISPPQSPAAHESVREPARVSLGPMSLGDLERLATADVPSRDLLADPSNFPLSLLARPEGPSSGAGAANRGSVFLDEQDLVSGYETSTDDDAASMPGFRAVPWARAKAELAQRQQSLSAMSDSLVHRVPSSSPSVGSQRRPSERIMLASGRTRSGLSRSGAEATDGSNDDSDVGSPTQARHPSQVHYHSHPHPHRQGHRFDIHPKIAAAAPYLARLETTTDQVHRIHSLPSQASITTISPLSEISTPSTMLAQSSETEGTPFRAHNRASSPYMTIEELAEAASDSPSDPEIPAQLHTTFRPTRLGQTPETPAGIVTDDAEPEPLLVSPGVVFTRTILEPLSEGTEDESVSLASGRVPVKSLLDVISAYDAAQASSEDSSGSQRGGRPTVLSPVPRRMPVPSFLLEAYSDATGLGRHEYAEQAPHHPEFRPSSIHSDGNYPQPYPSDDDDPQNSAFLELYRTMPHLRGSAKSPTQSPSIQSSARIVSVSDNQSTHTVEDVLQKTEVIPIEITDQCRTAATSEKPAKRSIFQRWFRSGRK